MVDGNEVLLGYNIRYHHSYYQGSIMKGEKAVKIGKKKPGKIRVTVIIGFLLFFSGMGLGAENEWSVPPWGLNLEELNRVIQEKYKNSQIKEDKDRSEIEFQYAPAKSLRIRKGKLVALLSITDPSAAGGLYGYAYEGLFFGRTIFFKDHPTLFPETAIRKLKEQFPQGIVSRSFNTTRGSFYFEYKSDQFYIFVTEKGVFYYEPTVLEKVVRIEQGLFEQEEKRIDQKVRDQRDKP
jgi:hypothetical protein